MKTVYVSIGNSDDKLTQAQWHDFVVRVDSAIRTYSSHVYGEWFSRPDSRYQNACWCFEPKDAAELKRLLELARDFYKQDSIAWADAITTFIAQPQPEEA